MRQRCAEESVWFTRTSPKHRASNRYTHSNCLQRGGQHLIHRHATTLAILDIGCSHSKYSAVEVDVSQVSESSSEARNLVCEAVITRGRSWGPQWTSNPVSSSGVRMRMRPLFSRVKRTFFTVFSVALPQVMAIMYRFCRKTSARLIVTLLLPCCFRWRR
jgi:hypothetical protein